MNARDIDKGRWICLKCHGKSFQAPAPPMLSDEEYEEYVRERRASQQRDRRSRPRPKRRTCPGCCSEFPVKPRGRIPRWCSDECRIKHQSVSTDGELRVCAAARCNMEFYSYNGTQIYCSSGCQKSPDAERRRSCPRCSLPLQEEEDESGRYCPACGWSVFWQLGDFRQCAECGKEFIPKSKRNIYCKRQCAEAPAVRRRRLKRVEVRERRLAEQESQ